MTSETFTIKTEIFEGPLELLLDLIDKRKLLINDFSLAEVTDEYMAYVGTLEERHLRTTTHFILIAATLLLIKSRSLLPVLTLTEEEEASIDDLERRLRLYKLYTRASATIKQTFGKRVLYARPYVPSTTPLFTPDQYTSLQALQEGIRNVLANLPKKALPRVQVPVRSVVSLEDMMKRLEERVSKQLKISFRNFSGNARERADVIVSFLAVLELVKQGIVMARQESKFADFDIERERVDTPQYT